MPTSNERKMLSSNEALKELKSILYRSAGVNLSKARLLDVAA